MKHHAQILAEAEGFEVVEEAVLCPKLIFENNYVRAFYSWKELETWIEGYRTACAVHRINGHYLPGHDDPKADSEE